MSKLKKPTVANKKSLLLKKLETEKKKELSEILRKFGPEQKRYSSEIFRKLKENSSSGTNLKLERISPAKLLQKLSEDLQSFADIYEELEEKHKKDKIFYNTMILDCFQDAGNILLMSMRDAGAFPQHHQLLTTFDIKSAQNRTEAYKWLWEQIIEILRFKYALGTLDQTFPDDLRLVANDLKIQAEETKAETKRKTKNEKIALITDALTDNPNATSAEIGRAKGINESDVRKLWGTIKERMKTGRRHRGQSKTDIADPSASCKTCNAPLSGPFECEFCKNIIVGECKTCHYTNEHPDDAIP